MTSWVVRAVARFGVGAPLNRAARPSLRSRCKKSSCGRPIARRWRKDAAGRLFHLTSQQTMPAARAQEKEMLTCPSRPRRLAQVRALWENRREQVAMASTTASLSTTLDDRELARLAVAGDGDAFAQLYDRHERRVFGFCLRMLGTEDEAADATQETFMRLLRRLPALQGRDLNFVAYALDDGTQRVLRHDRGQAPRHARRRAARAGRLGAGGARTRPGARRAAGGDARGRARGQCRAARAPA